MIVTEEEAKTKRCQEAFGPMPQATVTMGQSVPFNHGASGQMQYWPPSMGTAPVNCLGSACMAWRAVMPTVERTETDLGCMPKGKDWHQVDRGESYGLVWERVVAPGGGFCGKAGKP